MVLHEELKCREAANENIKKRCRCDADLDSWKTAGNP